MTPIVALSSVIKNYQGLRPLRIASLAIGPHERVALTGVDRVMAEVLADLITGATLPDSGDVTVFGRSTSTLAGGDDWLSLIERIGIVSERAVLLDSLTVIQNLAIPFSLEIEPPSIELRERAAALAIEVGLIRASWDQPVATLGPLDRLRLRFGRALALDPALLLWEHPSAALARAEIVGAAADVRGVLGRRNVASLTLTADRAYADALTDTVLTLDAATGRLADTHRGWFGRRSRTL